MTAARFLSVAAFALAGCASAPGPARAPLPPEPARVAQPEPPQAQSSASAAMTAYYASVEARLRAEGKLRRDGGSELALTDRIVADNYLRIALRDEYSSQGGRLVAQEASSDLRRWTGPIRLGLEFSPSVPEAQRRADKAMVSSLAHKLSGIAVHPVSLGAGPGNFTVLVLSDDERRAAGPRLARLAPGIDAAAVSVITQMDPSTYCMVLAFSNGASPIYTRAIAVIRAELPASMREMCLHEELAQGMGLANDSPLARPSVFNDDEEFSTLTAQDEMFLRIHYDPRLKPGMTEAEARPIVQDIAAGFFGGTS